MTPQHASPIDGSDRTRSFSQLKASAAQFDRYVRHDRMVQADPSGGGIAQEETAAANCPDRLMERLVRALLSQKQADDVLRGFYTDLLHATLVKRLVELRGDTPRT